MARLFIPSKTIEEHNFMHYALTALTRNAFFYALYSHLCISFIPSEFMHVMHRLQTFERV